jgi:hypothetical protein
MPLPPPVTAATFPSSLNMHYKIYLQHAAAILANLHKEKGEQQTGLQVRYCFQHRHSSNILSLLKAGTSCICKTRL